MDKQHPTSIIQLESNSGIAFESAYTAMRRREGRVYPDEVVARLPFLTSNFLLFTEWNKRAQSCRRLRLYLQQKSPGLNILEIGCGNGWLSHRMSSVNGARVYGADLSIAELEQAARVFEPKPNLTFVYSGIDALSALSMQFDIIVFASSVQYFPSIVQVVEKAKTLLKPGGEIHILDSPLYAAQDIPLAKTRSSEYYRSIGFPEMEQFYFHHSFEEVQKLGFRVLYSPLTEGWLLKRYLNPFYWVCLKC